MAYDGEYSIALITEFIYVNTTMYNEYAEFYETRKKAKNG